MYVSELRAWCCGKRCNHICAWCKTTINDNAFATDNIRCFTIPTLSKCLLTQCFWATSCFNKTAKTGDLFNCAKTDCFSFTFGFFNRSTTNTICTRFSSVCNAFCFGFLITRSFGSGS